LHKKGYQNAKHTIKNEDKGISKASAFETPRVSATSSVPDVSKEWMWSEKLHQPSSLVALSVWNVIPVQLLRAYSYESYQFPVREKVHRLQ